MERSDSPVSAASSRIDRYCTLVGWILEADVSFGSATGVSRFLSVPDLLLFREGREYFKVFLQGRCRTYLLSLPLPPGCLVIPLRSVVLQRPLCLLHRQRRVVLGPTRVE